jgi:hypothetical protein
VGSIFWKTQDIGLASSSNNLSTVGAVSFSALDGGWEEGMIGAMSDVMW